jgi:hypothetical protein
MRSPFERFGSNGGNTGSPVGAARHPRRPVTLDAPSRLATRPGRHRLDGLAVAHRAAAANLGRRVQDEGQDDGVLDGPDLRFRRGRERPLSASPKV